MEITASTIRNVEFRERLRGYHQGDVDEFLEEVAAAVERMEDELRRAERAERAAQADAPAAPGLVVAGGAEAVPEELQGPGDSFRRTFELAQRAADLAVQEANERGSARVAAAEAEAQAIVAEAQERARSLSESASAHIKAEVARLEVAREELRADLDRLTRLVEQARTRAQAWVAQLAAAVDKPIDPPGAAPEPREDPPPLAEAWDE